MAVEDSELLALAGGDSSDEEEMPQQSTTKRDANSPLPSIEISQAPNNRVANGKKPAAASARSSSHKAKQRPRHQSDEEEGEASSTRSSPDSLQSAPMSESDSEMSANADSPMEDDPFPVEGRFLSENDKEYMLGLPEIEREQILAERAADAERRKQDQYLRRLRVEQNKAAKNSKRKAPADVEESPRKSSRQKMTLGGRVVGETSKPIQAYKREREERGLKAQQRKANAQSRNQNRARSPSERRLSSVDGDGESEVDWDDGRYKADEERFRSAKPGDYHDFRRVTLKRSFLAEFCFHPGFEQKIAGCYVRLPQKSMPGAPSNAYQLAKIHSVSEKEGWPYAMTKDNGKKIVTSHHLALVVDGSTKDFHMNSVSNTIPSEVEVANHKNGLSNDGKAIPTRPFLESKIDDINSIIRYHFTEAELQEKLVRSGIAQKRNAAIESIAIQTRRRAAEERGDEAAVAQCDADMAALNGPKLKYGTSLDDAIPVVAVSAAPPPLTQQERLAELNRINRKKNTEDVRKAQLAERKAARLAREAVMRGEAVEDPFARVKTKAKTHYDVNEVLAPHRRLEQNLSRNASRSATPNGLGTPKLEPKKLSPSASPRIRHQMKNGLPVLGSRNMDDEIIGAMDLNIDIEI